MINDLKNLGLSENESKVYLAMLELGSATMLEIAAKAEINRPTAYVQVESLKKKGLVSAQTKGKKTFFIPESPDHLESILNQELKGIQDKKESLTKLMPELSVMFNLLGDKPQVRYFEGKEGILKIYEEFLKTKANMVYGISSFDNVLEVFPNYFKSNAPRRVEKSVSSKLIYTSSRGPFLKESDGRFLRESKYVEPSNLPLSSDISIFDDKIAIIALRGKIFGAIIEHREVADSFKSIFNLLWGKL